MQKPSSYKTYQSLVQSLWKDFVDQSLCSLLWFDEVVDTAQMMHHTDRYTDTVSIQLQWILSDMDNAITFAKQSFLKQREERLQHHFWYLTDESSLEDFNLLLDIMMEDIIDTMDSRSLEQLYYDYYVIIDLPSLKFEYPHIFNHEFEQIGRYGYPHGAMSGYIDHKKFMQQFQRFITWLSTKLQQASSQELIKIFTMSEFFRHQSWTREGIGNLMNPMIQMSSLEELFGANDAKHISWILSKTLFTLQKHIPWTSHHKRNLINKTIKNMNANYFFPSKLIKH